MGIGVFGGFGSIPISTSVVRIDSLSEVFARFSSLSMPVPGPKIAAE